MKIEDKRVVTFHYELKDDQGALLDSSTGGEPLVYLQGSHGVVPGLEQALTGKSAGDQFDLTLQPEDAYGPVRPELVQTVPREAFASVNEVRPGMRFRAEDQEGRSQAILVREVTDESVTVDANHPLAGQVLHFAISVEKVRPATADELAHGHAH
jgi:FKBP-type peptidyl-prolyl cis-trans isomerase SlyD